MIDALLHVMHNPIELPTDGSFGKATAFRIWANLISRSDHNLEVFVSAETQSRETGINSRTITNARKVFEDSGLMTFTGKRRRKGVKVWRLHIAGFDLEAVAGATDHHPTAATVRGSVAGSVAALGVGAVVGTVVGVSRDEQNRTEQNPTEPAPQVETAALEWVVARCLELDHHTAPIRTAKLRLEREAKYRELARKELAAHHPDAPLDRIAIVIVQENHPLRRENSRDGRTALWDYRR